VQTDALGHTKNFVNNSVGRKEESSYTLNNPFSSPFPPTLCHSQFLQKNPCFDKEKIILELWWQG